MSVMYLALPVALLLVFVAFLAFRWCIHTGQLDDLDNASYRMLHDDATGNERSFRNGSHRSKFSDLRDKAGKNDTKPKE